TNSDVLNETAICLMELGDFKGAKKELERALRRESENTKIISNLGVLALKTGKQDEAAAFFRAVLELDPEDPLATHYLEKT
ncbi:MAG: tetratricopeptide repeat protein, partial [Treponema sp.]|nr:tetratricopeptide repeat protein [Treponema sp.]